MPKPKPNFMIPLNTPPMSPLDASDESKDSPDRTTSHPFTRHTHRAPNTPEISHLDFKNSFFDSEVKRDTTQDASRNDSDDDSDDAMVLPSSRRSASNGFPTSEKRPSFAFGDAHGLPSMKTHTHRAHKTPFSTFISRKYRRVVLVATVIFVFFLLFRAQQSASSTPSLHKVLRNKQAKLAFLSKPKTAAITAVGRPSAMAKAPENVFSWKEGEELAGLIGFLASASPTSPHALPPNAGEFIDPELVLDFDPLRSSDPRADMEEMIETVWRERVVVLLAKSYGNPRTKAIQATLAEMRVIPAPVVIEVDRRADTDQLVPVLSRLLDATIDEFPILLVGGKKVPAADLVESKLRTLVTEAGGSFRALKKKKGKF